MREVGGERGQKSLSLFLFKDQTKTFIITTSMDMILTFAAMIIIMNKVNFLIPGFNWVEYNICIHSGCLRDSRNSF